MTDMETVQRLDDPVLIDTLLTSGVAVIRTDTLYGVVCRADDEVAVNRIYKLKGRDETKSPIVMIADRSMLFDVPSQELSDALARVWPGKVSVIVPSQSAPLWLRRDNDSVAYRLPDDEQLQTLIAKTGPLIAPSANPEGQPPAMSCREAKQYFGHEVDVYVDGGRVSDDRPSQLIRIHNDGSEERLR